MNRVCLSALYQLVSSDLKLIRGMLFYGSERVPAAAVDALIVLNNEAAKNKAKNEAKSTGH